MRALLSPIGSRGDIQPMLALGLELNSRGHEVLFCAPPDFEEWVRGYGLSFHPVGVDMTASLEKAYKEGVGLRAVSSWVATMLTDQFKDLAKVGDGFDVVMGAGAQCAAPALAGRLGVPYIYVAHCPDFTRSSYHPPTFFVNQRLPRLFNRMQWWLYATVGNAIVLRALNQCLASFDHPPIDDCYPFIFEPRHVFMATDEELGPLAPDFGPHVRQAGFWFLEDPTPLDEQLLEFIDAGEPPVYVGFGSIPIHRPERLARTIARVAEMTGRRLVVGAGRVGDAMVGRLPESCHIIGAADHGKLFPRMAAVVHHGGAGTTGLTARSGVPHIVVPHTADQFYWGHRVADLGIGSKPLRFKHLTTKRLARRIEEVTTRGEIVESARELGETMRARRNVEGAADMVEALNADVPPQPDEDN